jgi:hypothetical protein
MPHLSTTINQPKKRRQPFLFVSLVDVVVFSTEELENNKNSNEFSIVRIFQTTSHL